MIKAPKFPLAFSEKKFFENVRDAKELVRFHIRNLLLTNPGEKISDPKYGVGIRKMLFENATQDLLNTWKGIIEDAIQKYLPYIELKAVLLRSELEQNKISIKIVYGVDDSSEPEILDIEMGDSSAIQSPLAY